MTDLNQSAVKPQRRWLSFSLRTMAVLLTAICLFLGWIGPKWLEAQREAAIVKQLAKSGALIQYDYVDQWKQEASKPVPQGAFVLRYLFGKHILSRVTKVQFHTECKPNEVAHLLPQLTQIRRLNFDGNEVLTDESVRAIAQCKNLTTIQMATGVLSADQLAMLSQVESIECLYLKDESASDDCLKQLARFPNLKLLSISSEHTTDTGFQAIAEISSLESLETSYLPQITNEAVKPLYRLTQLKEFSTRQGFGPIDQLTEGCLPDLFKIHSLEKLHLSFQSAFSETDVEFDPSQYEGLEKLHQLTYLSLRKANLQDEVLQRIGKLTQLQELDLSHTDITDEGLVHLTNLQELRVLNIFWTQVTHKGLRHLANLPALEVVEFDSGDEAEVETLRSLGFTNRTGFGQVRWEVPQKSKPDTLGFGR